MANTIIDHGLSDSTVTALIQVFASFPLIESVILYGSRAKGNYHQGSDIDFAVIAPNMNDAEFSKLCLALDDLPIIYKLDCLHLEKLKNTALRKNIRNQGKLFYNAVTA